MTENPIWDRYTPRWVGLWDTREYSDVRHICFKFKGKIRIFSYVFIIKLTVWQEQSLIQCL